VVSYGGKGSFGNVDKFSKSIDGTFDRIFQLLLLILDGWLELLRQCIAFGFELLAILDYSSCKGEQFLVIVGIVGQLLEWFFVHC
jgi:hypothetical protein